MGSAAWVPDLSFCWWLFAALHAVQLVHCVTGRQKLWHDCKAQCMLVCILCACHEVLCYTDLHLFANFFSNFFWLRLRFPACTC
jgi:hypothetical protein